MLSKRVMKNVKGRELSFVLYYTFVECPICDILFSLYKRKIRKDVPSGVVKKVIQGSWMELNLNDGGLNTDLYIHGIRERKATKKMQEVITKGCVAVDIGANVGYYVLMEAQKAKKVYAIEPIKENIDMIKKNLSLNPYDNVEVYTMAIGDKDGSERIYLSNHSNLHSMTNKGGKYRTIEVQTLDTFLKDRLVPDIVRMDVEGYEYEILHGMSDTLQRMKKGSWIFLEVHGWHRERSKEVVRMIEEAGFELDSAFIEWERIDKYSPITYRNKFPGIDHSRISKECFFRKVID